jgi:hypothetical protein
MSGGAVSWRALKLTKKNFKLVVSLLKLRFLASLYNLRFRL